MKTCSLVLTFDSVNEVLWFDHSKETSSAVPLQEIWIFLNFYFGTLGSYKGLRQGYT